MYSVDRTNALRTVQFLNNEFRREKRGRPVKLSEEPIALRDIYLRELREN